MKRVSLGIVLLAGLGAGTYFGGNLIQGQPTPAPVQPKEPHSYRDVVKTVLPAVVSIESRAKIVKTKVQPQRPQPGEGQLPEGVPPEFRRFFEEFKRAPELNDVPRSGFGSGFFIDPSGVILTNFHVVDGADQVSVTLNDGRKFIGKTIRGDRRTDLAIVVLDNKGPFPTLSMADSDTMEIGDRVLAVGAPFGLTGSVTHGIISAKGRNGLNMNMYEDFVQTDAAINPGNSGGPLVNMEGKVVGINSAIKSRSGGFQGVGLAIASNMAQKVVKALQADGVVRRGYLGVQIRDLDPEVAARLNIGKDTGVVVGEVFDNTPASRAGILAGDIITAIAGKNVKDGRVLQGMVAELPLKKPVEMKIVRDNQPLTLQVVIEEQPNDFGTASAPAPRPPQITPETVGIAKVGLEVADLNDNMAVDLGFKKGTQGVVITRVEPGSTAAEAGLRRGMLIAKVDNQKVTTAAAAQQALQNALLARGVLLQIQSPAGGTNFVLLKGTGE